MAILEIETDDGRKVEISRGSDIYVKQNGDEELYWETRPLQNSGKREFIRSFPACVS